MDEWEGAGKTAIIISGWNPALGDPEALITNGAGALQVAIAGTVATGALTDAQLRAAPVPVSGPLTDAQLRAVAVPVSISGSVPVTGTFWQVTQPVSGPLTDAQLRAVAVPVSGTFWQATQPVSAAALPLPAGASTEATLGTVFTRLGDGSTRLAADALTGAAPPTRAIQVAGSDGALLRAILTDSSGRVQTNVGGTVTVAGAVTADPSSGQGKTLLFGTITQGAAGTTQLVAADATKKVKLVSYVVVLDAAGSVKFTDGVADLSGAMAVAANGGVSAIGQPSAHLLETGAINRALSITTVTGKAFGHFSYFKEA